jgi:hypothetical protein
MKQLITLLLIFGALYLAKVLYQHYKEVERKGDYAEEKTEAKPANAPVATLPGLAPQYEASLQNAKKQGAAGLKKWLDQYRRWVSDPRLADIELDYVVLVGPSNPSEARRVFKEVKARTPLNSPVQVRIKSLAKTYE